MYEVTKHNQTNAISTYPASTRRWPIVDLMLAHRIRRPPNKKTPFGQRLVFAGKLTRIISLTFFTSRVNKSNDYLTDLFEIRRACLIMRGDSWPSVPRMFPWWWLCEQDLLSSATWWQFQVQLFMSTQ